MKKIFALASILFAASAFAQDKVSVSDLEVVKVNEIPMIQGVATNNTESSVKFVFVKFKLYEGAMVVGNAIAKGSDIGPGEQWRFQAPVLERFDSFKLSSVDIY